MFLPGPRRLRTVRYSPLTASGTPLEPARTTRRPRRPPAGSPLDGHVSCPSSGESCPSCRWMSCRSPCRGGARGVSGTGRTLSPGRSCRGAEDAARPSTVRNGPAVAPGSNGAIGSIRPASISVLADPGFPCFCMSPGCGGSTDIDLFRHILPDMCPLRGPQHLKYERSPLAHHTSR